MVKRTKQEIENRNGCVQWFFTFPRWEEYSDIKIFEKIFKNSKWARVVKESHDTPDEDTTRNSMIHYHLTTVLKYKMSTSQLSKQLEVLFPGNNCRIHFRPTKDTKGLGIHYLEKQELDVHEWGDLRNVPIWLKAIRDEWESTRIERENCEKRIKERIAQRMKELYENEHNSVFCWCCDKVLPCDDHDGESIFSEL